MRNRTRIELLLLLPLLYAGIHVWQRGLNRSPANTNTPDTAPAATHRVQELIRKTPDTTPAASTPAADPGPSPDTPAPAPPAQFTARVTIQVLESDGTLPLDAVLIFSPDGSLYESAPLGQLILSADPGPLTLQASATDGSALRLSEAHTLQLESGEQHTLQIRLPQPETPIGVPGFALLPGDGYALITEILPDSPAQRAGLQPGDAVLAVNGIPTANLTPDQLETLLIGPADQPIKLSLILQHDTGEFEEVEALINRLPLP